MNSRIVLAAEYIYLQGCVAGIRDDNFQRTGRLNLVMTAVGLSHCSNIGQRAPAVRHLEAEQRTNKAQ